MFTVYHSNQLDILKSLLVELIRREPLSNPLQAECILVQSPGMSQWLKLALAQEQGIAANLHFPLPATFIWQLFIDVLGDVPSRSAFNKDAMTWKLVGLLPEMLTQAEFAPLAAYLAEDNDGYKRYQLAAKIADIFDQYLVYRPEWIAAWEEGRDVDLHEGQHPWQPLLWRALYQQTLALGQSHYHRGNLYQQLIETLSQCAESGALPASLPPRLFVFGISALPPRYLDALEALGEHIDVHLMFTNPCRHYWGDIRDQRFIDKMAKRFHRQIIWLDDHSEMAGEKSTLKGQPEDNLEEAHHLNPLGNSLLASMGKLGRDNLCLLAEKEAVEIDAFVEIERTGLLQHIQADILELEDRNSETLYLDSQHKIGLASDDRSLTIHACHSAMREVEVLHDQLLAQLDADHNLHARDIVVMVSDINRYSPAIQSVFGNASAERYIPFSISDRSADTENPILLAFHHILALPRLRCTASELQTLLEVPAVMRRFAIEEKDLPQLAQWLEECGVRWGLDAHTAEEFALPSQHANTWLFGLQRMVLGYAMPSEMGLFQGQMAYDEVQGLNAELAGKLGMFVETVIGLRRALSQPQPPHDWLHLINQVLDSMFVFDLDDERVIALIRDKTEQLLTQLEDAAYLDEISPAIVTSYYKQALNNERVSQRFLAGQVNFCTLMPMRSIPFKVVCLLGMNEGSYPRSTAPEGFDLMNADPRRGDRSRRDDDRYLFLEALLSAQQCLYISYIGRSIQDNTEKMPSLLVTELLEYCEQGYCLEGQQSLDPTESSRMLQRHLIQAHPMVPYSPAAFAGDAPSFAKEWLPVAKGSTGEGTVFDQQPLPVFELPIEPIALPELLRFWRLPVQYFFNRRLKVWFGQDVTENNDDEPFAFEALERYQMRASLLEWAILHGDDEATLANFRAQQQAAGRLPHAAFGALTLTDIERDVLPLARRIRALSHCPEMDVEVRLSDESGFKLQGWLKQIYPSAMIRYRPGNWRSVDLLATWLEHLCLNAMGHAKPSWFIAMDAELHFAPLPSSTAMSLLQPYFCGLQDGMNQPMVYFPKTALAGLNDPEKAASKMQTAFESGFVPGEGSDPYIQRVWPNWESVPLEMLESLAQQYLKPALDWVVIEKRE
ncbi:exodeoxyribonuclease V subunit gamma [Thaumasiovibrio sp. DFM-14]|uniref:exodeoxyribonuclease V subunit gamma n=1 Tax=Thaumasiovibrio sp. DFM-14 TaxID=3384792 RepID=UPI0039A26D9F